MNKLYSKLLFIYNADSGMINALMDQGKKYLTPSEYACQLCMVSYGPFGMRKDWKKFTKELPYEIEFLHKDELQNTYPTIETSLPAMVLLSNENADVLLDKEDFNTIVSLDDLKTAVLKALER